MQSQAIPRATLVASTAALRLFKTAVFEVASSTVPPPFCLVGVEVLRMLLVVLDEVEDW